MIQLIFTENKITGCCRHIKKLYFNLFQCCDSHNEFDNPFVDAIFRKKDQIPKSNFIAN